MQRRLDRAVRRFRKLQPLLQKQKETDPTAATLEAEAVEDDFAHIISEMKNVRYEFGGWCEANGQTGTGNRRLDNWSNSNLSPEEQDVWMLIREVRDYDIHREPISPERRPAYLSLQTTEGFLVLQTNPYVVQLVFKNGSSRTLQVLPFCTQAMMTLQKFINEFERL